MPTATTTKKKPKNTKMPIGKLVKKVSSDILLIAIPVAALCIFGYLYIRAEEIGGEIGTTAGRAAGRFTGSYEGITEGLAEGAEEGKEEGLSAKDTTVDIGNKVRNMGKLEVLSASVVLHDVIKDSDKYSSLLAFYGDITFSVDLYEAEIDIDGSTYNVTIPPPKSTVRIDDRRSEQLAKDMKYQWSGSNKDGYTAAMNSVDQLTIKAEESINNYDYLMESAKSSAQKQIEFLIQSATKEEVVVHVSFKDSITEE